MVLAMPPSYSQSDITISALSRCGIEGSALGWEKVLLHMQAVEEDPPGFSRDCFVVCVAIHPREVAGRTCIAIM
jgi:hypothetical protein